MLITTQRRAWPLLLLILTALFVFLPGTLLAQAPVPTPTPSTLIRGHVVKYLGRDYDGSDTTFTYEVCRPDGVNPGISHFVLGLPFCDPTLSLKETSGDGTVTIGTDPTTGVDGVKFDNPSIAEDSCEEFALTFNGEVGEDIINVAVKAGTSSAANQIGQLPGPACLSFKRLCTRESVSRIVVMLDRTGSIDDLELEDQKAAARVFLASLEGLSPKPYVAIGTFNIQGGPDARIVSGLTNTYGGQNPSTGLYGAIDSISGTGGNTDVRRALEIAAIELATLPNPNDDPNFVILVSDGVTNRPGAIGARPGDVEFDNCSDCGCVAAYDAASLAADAIENPADLSGDIFAIHYEGTGGSTVCTNEPANGIAFMRDFIASKQDFYYQGNEYLAGVFQAVVDQIVCGIDDACRTFTCAGDECIGTSIVAGDPDATEGGSCTPLQIQGALGQCAFGTYDDQCMCEPNQPETEICDDNIDNDCDGKTDNEDEDCFECVPDTSESQDCDTLEDGVCADGTQSRDCVAGFWTEYGQCMRVTDPVTEEDFEDPICDDGLDNDCDGFTDVLDPGCFECDPDPIKDETDTMACSTSFPGVCEPGMKERTCLPTGMWGEFGDCVPNVDPVSVQDSENTTNQNCGDQIDNDCDGLVDVLDQGCFECTPSTPGVPGDSETVSCDSGLEGICEPGSQSRDCVNGFWTDFSTCAADVQPGEQEESPSAGTCDDDFDNDCDGLTDKEDPDCFECVPGATEVQDCDDTGLPGVCTNGTESRECLDSGVWSEYGECVPTLTPSSQEEVCDGADNDCDEDVDEGFDVGASCEIPGDNGCVTPGLIECTEDGGTVCLASGPEECPRPPSAPPTPTPTPEAPNVAIECTDLDITSTQFTIDGNLLQMSRLVRKLGRKILRSAESKRQQKRLRSFVSNSRQEAAGLTELGWQQTWSLPAIQTTCIGSDVSALCVEVNNASTIQSFLSTSDDLNDLIKKSVRKLKRVSGRRKAGRRFAQRGEKLVDDNEAVALNIPTVASSCNLPT